MQVAVRPLTVVRHVVGPVPDDSDAMALLRINASTIRTPLRVVSSAPSLVHCHVSVPASVCGMRTSAQTRSMTPLTMGFACDICTVPVLAVISQSADAHQ